MARTWNPNTADWLKAQRGKTKQDTIVEALAEKGQAISRSWLSRIENGEPFSDELMAAFVDLYGSVPPPYEEPADEPPGDLAAAIRQQSEAILKMTESINVAALAVLTSQAQVHGGQVALGDLLARLAAGETLAELARSLQNGPA